MINFFSYFITCKNVSSITDVIGEKQRLFSLNTTFLIKHHTDPYSRDYIYQVIRWHNGCYCNIYSLINGCITLGFTCYVIL